MSVQNVLLVLVISGLVVMMMTALALAGGMVWPLALAGGLGSGGVTFAVVWNLLR